MVWRCSPAPLVVVALFAAACRTTPTDSAACQTINAQVNRLVSTSKSCSSDAECSCYSSTACGLYGECGLAVNGRAKAQLDQLITEWSLDCPIEAASCGDCPARATIARCIANLCSCTTS
jgi:hypothetical protein